MKRCMLLVALTACSDFPTPSALDRPQILAVRSSPPGLVPGETAQLDALVAGPDGVITAPLAWSLLEPVDGVTLEAATLSTTPSATGEVTIVLVSDDLAAEKTVAIGQRADNPDIVATVNGSDEDTASAGIGEMVELAATGADRVTWYSTCGEIVRYRDAVTQLATADDPCDGWVIAVGRDQAFGVTWRVIRMRVE